MIWEVYSSDEYTIEMEKYIQVMNIFNQVSDNEDLKLGSIFNGWTCFWNGRIYSSDEYIQPSMIENENLKLRSIFKGWIHFWNGKIYSSDEYIQPSGMKNQDLKWGYMINLSRLNRHGARGKWLNTLSLELAWHRGNIFNPFEHKINSRNWFQDGIWLILSSKSVEYLIWKEVWSRVKARQSERESQNKVAWVTTRPQEASRPGLGGYPSPKRKSHFE